MQLRQESAPLLKEREQYLTYLLQQGAALTKLRRTAAYLVHIVRVMNMTSLRTIGRGEIDRAGQFWAEYAGPNRKNWKTKGSPTVFVRIAKGWLRFHKQLKVPPPHPFSGVIADFVEAMRSTRGLAPGGWYCIASLHSDRISIVRLAPQFCR